eukprot:3250780-Amphidinium_carterae.1
MVAASYLPKVGPSLLMRVMAICSVAIFSLAAVLDSYHIVHPLVGCQDVVHSASIRDTLSVMASGDARDNEYIYEPYNRTMHADAHYHLVPTLMKLTESVIHSLADEYINHFTGIEGNDSSEWYFFPLKVSTRVPTRESSPEAMNLNLDLDNIDMLDDNHTDQPGLDLKHDEQSVRGNHGLAIPMRPFSMGADDHVHTTITSCIIAAGVPEWSSDTCCPRRP